MWLNLASTRRSGILAHPYKTRIIAKAQIKTDGIDAQVLAHLLRADLIAPAHMADTNTRPLKALLRQRSFGVKQRTLVRNCIHQLLDRQWDAERPECSDLLGKMGLGWMNALAMEGTDGLLLRQDLQMHATLELSIRELEKDLQGRLGQSEDLKL